MNRKLLIAGLSASVIMAVTAYGYRTSALASSSSDIVEISCNLQEIVKSAGAETLKDSPYVMITAFAAAVQDAVHARDIDALAGLCDFPVTVATPEGLSLIINTKEEFLALEESSVFTQNLVHEIGIADPAKQQLYGNGIVMGNKNNVIINRIDGALAITGFIF